MRACVIAVGMIALAQPAFARDIHKAHHGARHHHYAAHSHHRVAVHHRKHARFVRVRQAPIESGYAMPKSFGAPAPAPGFAPSAPAPGFAMEAQPRRMARAAAPRDGALDAAIARHAAANGLPVELVHRVVIRESRYNPRARNGPNLGLMQIQHATARGVGYTGSAAGLFDAETNLTYAVKYLAGAYRAAGGNQSRAVAYYASGYHGRGVATARRTPRERVTEASASSWGAAPAWGMQAQASMRDDAMVIRHDMPRQRRARR
jgi:soluble lytic murein transglycosylase-like protein